MVSRCWSQQLDVRANFLFDQLILCFAFISRLELFFANGREIASEFELLCDGLFRVLLACWWCCDGIARWFSPTLAFFCFEFVHFAIWSDLTSISWHTFASDGRRTTKTTSTHPTFLSNQSAVSRICCAHPHAWRSIVELVITHPMKKTPKSLFAIKINCFPRAANVFFLVFYAWKPNHQWDLSFKCFTLAFEVAFSSINHIFVCLQNSVDHGVTLFQPTTHTHTHPHTHWLTSMVLCPQQTFGRKV